MNSSGGKTHPVQTKKHGAASTLRPIEIRVDEARQLFETLDPFPFRERDLDQNAENYIVSWARELPSDAPLKIIVHLPEARAHDALATDLSVAFTRFFEYRAMGATADLKELFRLGRISMAIGFSVLIGSVIAAQQVGGLITSPSLARTVEESLLILGWVANWRPLEIILYDWWPILRKRSLYRRLSQAHVEIEPLKSSKEAPV